jgi:hypothetical protein
MQVTQGEKKMAAAAVQLGGSVLIWHMPEMAVFLAIWVLYWELYWHPRQPEARFFCGQ